MEGREYGRRDSIDMALRWSAGSRDLEIAPTDGGGESWRGGRSYKRLVGGAHPTTAKSRPGDRSYRIKGWWAVPTLRLLNRDREVEGFLSRSLCRRLISISSRLIVFPSVDR